MKELICHNGRCQYCSSEDTFRYRYIGDRKIYRCPACGNEDIGVAVVCKRCRCHFKEEDIVDNLCSECRRKKKEAEDFTNYMKQF